MRIVVTSLFSSTISQEVAREQLFYLPVSVSTRFQQHHCGKVNIMALTVNFLPFKMPVKVGSSMQMSDNT